MTFVSPSELYQWCKVPYQDLVSHPEREMPFRLCADSAEMGADHGARAGGRDPGAQRPRRADARHHPLRAELLVRAVHRPGEPRAGQPARPGGLPHGRVPGLAGPRSCRGTIPTASAASWRSISTARSTRSWPCPRRTASGSTRATSTRCAQRIWAAPIDITYGGWGQDGHIAYNQARRHPFSHVTLDDVRNSTIRVQENNLDTIMALAQRTFGAAYQFVPPMSVTLGVKECLSAAKVRLFSDTGAWKQTALRVALFSPPTPEYPITLLQEHPDALITATVETARHPISEHPEWELGLRDA